MAKKKRPPVKKKKVVRKRRKQKTKLTLGKVAQNKQVAALSVVPAYEFRILETNKQPSVWDDE